MRMIPELNDSQTPARLLIVEDEKIIALDLQRRLQKYGYDVTALSNDAADAITRAHSDQPDLILMDIMLGGEKDGVQAAVEIYQELQIPIIFLTAYADQRTLERAKEAQPFGYVLKPFKERELYSTIDIALYKSSVEKKLQRHERWLGAVLDNVGDGIIATGSQGSVDYMNQAAEKLTGWDFDAAQGSSLAEIIPLHDAQTHLKVPIPDPTSISSDTPMFFENLLLINKAGAHIHIEGSFAGIYDESHSCEGLVVAFQDVTTIKTMSDTIMYQASHDSLTGLINRDEFFVQLKRVIANYTGDSSSHLLYIDIDQFKIVNDLCGHLAGDELLRQLSKEIRAALTTHSSLARLGGDEFGILLKAMNLDEVSDSCQSLLGLIQRKFTWKENEIAISASIGVVTIDQPETDPYSVLAAADDATYLAKESGGNTYRFYRTADFSFLKRRGEMQWAARLTTAVEQNRFALYEQPIIQLQSRNIVKHEILLRLLDENDEIISPQVFIPAAERYNLMPSIDRWVIRNTFGFIAEHNADHCFAINLSGASVADPELNSYISRQLHHYEVNPELITFEITETTAIENLSKAIEFISSMRDKGISFALDDFGSGFSSFNYLRNLPVEYLKLDGSYVKDIMNDPVSLQMVDSINDIGHVLGMQTIAEYVKSADLLTQLETMGVDMGQGFEIQKPAPLKGILVP